jgi:hypothetical protein
MSAKNDDKDIPNKPMHKIVRKKKTEVFVRRQTPSGTIGVNHKYPGL